MEAKEFFRAIRLNENRKKRVYFYSKLNNQDEMIIPIDWMKPALVTIPAFVEITMSGYVMYRTSENYKILGHIEEYDVIFK